MASSSVEGISSSTSPSLLLVEDNPKDARLLRDILKEDSYEVGLRWEEDLSTGLCALDEKLPDVIVTDLGLPDSEGIEAVQRLVEAAPNVPVVVLTGQKTMELAMASLDAGATEYLRKDELTPGLVARTLQTAMERKRIEAELRRQKAALRRSRKRYRSLFRDSSDAILVHDLEGRIQEVNPKAESLFGLSAEEFRGRSILSLRAAERKETVQERREALRAADSFRTVSRFERADGSEFWGELSANTIQIEDETLVRTIIRDVTDRKEAEQSLREREEQLRSLANSIPGVIYQFSVGSDGTYGFNYVSEHSETMLGLATDSDAPYEQFVERIPAPYRTEFAESVAEAVEQETTWRFEMPFEKPGGERIWLLATSTPERQNGDLVFNGVLLDITERKAAEEELRRSRDRLALQARMIDQVGQAVIATDGRGEITYWNSAAERIYGWTEEDILGENIMELTVPDAAQDVAYEILASLVEGDTWTGEFEAQRKDGSTFPAIVSDAPILDDDGELVGVIGVTTDITKQKQRELQLRERDRQLQQIRENITEVVWMSSPTKDAIEFVSDAYEDIWGHPAEKLAEHPMAFFEAVHPEDRERIRAALELQQEDPEAYEETYRVVQPSGEVRWVHDRTTGVYDENGRLERILGVATDVTEQKRREQTLEDRQDKVESLYAATNDLLTAKRPETVASCIHAVLRNTFDYPLTGVDLERDGALVFVRGTYEDGIQGPSGVPRSVEGESVAARAYRSGEPVVVENLAALDNEIDYGDLRSGASIPLGKHGVVNVGQVEQGEFDPFDLRLIEILAAHAGTVLDRLEREKDLREERDLLDRILETSPVAIVRFNREGDFVQASGRAEEILGLEKGAVTDRTYNDPEWGITTPDGDPVPDEELPFARVISTEEPVYNVEHTIEWPDGTRRLLSVSGAPLTAANGELEGTVFHLEDVTERRAAERALRESEQRFRGVFNNAAIGIGLLDHEGELLEVNPALAEMVGYDPDELQGHHFGDVTHPDDLEADQRRFEELVSGERDQYQIEKRYVRKDGTVFWGRLTVSRHDGTDEEQIIGMVEDIDEQKRYEEQLRAAKETAEEASRLKSAMLANMSHEIRTPLTAVTGFAELLAEQLTGQPRDFALRIERSGKRLTKTLDSVLHFSRLEAGATNLNWESIRLDDIAQEVVEMLRSMAQEQSVTVELSVPDGPVTGQWNGAALNRIVENLLENAIKFTTAGGRVGLRVQEEDGAAVLVVEDTGIGIEEEAQSRIFKAFEQESNGLDRDYEGSGLGLSIVKKLVEAHGGTITVDSEKGRGTCVTVRLPFTPPE